MRALASCAAARGPGASSAASSDASKTRTNPDLPADAEAHAENRVLVRALERMRIEELERQHAEHDGARRDASAEDRHAFVRVPAEAPVHRLARAPGRAGVDEERELGRRGGRVEDAEVLRTEQRETQLEVGDGDAAADEALELRARRERGQARGRSALREVEGVEIVAAHERVAADVEQ